MSLIKINNVSFSYDGSNEIFKKLSFHIDSSWRLGFIGRNGKGKTTFLKLLMNEYEYSGSIQSNEIFTYFPNSLDNKNLETRNLIVQINEEIQEWELIRELSYLNINEEVLNRNFLSLSPGEQTKVLLAVLFLKEHTFLLIDEVTNHLDSEGRQLVAKYLKSKQGFILVSHDRSFIDECVDHVLVMNKSKIEVLNGNFSSWWSNKQKQDQSEINENIRLKKDMRRLKEGAERLNLWSDKIEASKFGQGPVDRGFIGAKSASMMKRAKNVEKRFEKNYEDKKQLLKDVEEVAPLKLSPLKYTSKKYVELENVACYYDQQINAPVSFVVEEGDRIALCGSNGCGKTTIIKLIHREKIKYTGRLYENDRLIISYLTQDTSTLKGKLDDFIYQEGLDISLFKAILRKLDFSRLQFEKRLEDYSDGQKKKVLIAKSLCEKAHLYIWDEPLNYIDVFSRMQIEDLLMDFKGTMIFVEHDQTFSNKIATRKININKAETNH